MNIYITTKFKGHWPVGSSAVIIAKDEDEAIGHLKSALTPKGLGDQDWAEVKESLTTISPKKARAYILTDGDY